MLRHRCTQNIVNPEEGVYELRAVHKIHINVPRCADRCKDEETRGERNASERREIAPHKQEDEDDKPRQEEANRPLREDTESRTGVSDVEVFPPPLVVSEKERAECPAEEDKEAHIREDKLCKHRIEHARPKDDRRPERRSLIVDPTCKGIGQTQSPCSKKRRKEACGKIRHAKQGECRKEFPIKENRLVVPVVPIDLRREPVPRRQHLLCRLCIVHLDGSCYGKRTVAPKVKQDEAENRRNGRDSLIHHVPPSAPPRHADYHMR